MAAGAARSGRARGDAGLSAGLAVLASLPGYPAIRHVWKEITGTRR